MNYKKSFIYALCISFCWALLAHAGWIVETNVVDDSGVTGIYNSIAVDETGGVHIVYYDSGNKDLKYAFSSGTGGWNTGAIDPTDDVGSYCSIAIDSVNTPHVSCFRSYQKTIPIPYPPYSYNTPWGGLRYSVNSGSGWSFVEIDNNAGSFGQYTSIAVNSSDEPRVVYFDATQSKLWYKAKTGSSWGAASNVDSGGRGASLALDASGNAHISYVSSAGALRYARWNGSSWLKETVVASEVIDEKTSIVLDASGYPHIAYVSQDGIQYAFWNGTTWTIELVHNVYDAGAVGDSSPSLVLNSDDEPFISYHGNFWGDLAVVVAARVSTNDWETPIWLLEDATPGGQTSIAIDSNNVMYVSFYDSTAGSLVYAHVTEDLSDVDSDNDGLTDLQEAAIGTDPDDPDSDDDGLEDGEEFNTYETNPLNADSDDDGLDDGDEVNTHSTDPNHWDSDRDGITDGDEVNTHGTDPLDADSDNDGLTDGHELGYAHTFESFEEGEFRDDWTLGGDGLWTNVTDYAYDETYSARSPVLPINSSAWFEFSATNVPTGELGFWYRTDSVQDHHELVFFVNGTEKFRTSGVQVWNDEYVDLDTGSYTCRWEFVTDSTSIPATNTVWVDHILWTVTATGTSPTNSDSDADGLLDGAEVNTHGTDPLDTDSDNDGMPDGWEVDNSLAPTNALDAATDIEPDGLTNLEEYQKGTDPNVSDSDSDGMPDGWEVDNSLMPTNNTDAATDIEPDGLTNLEEYQNGTDPHDDDSDNDLMPDGWEVDNSLNPVIDDAAGDPDSDGLTNLQEYQYGTDPQVSNTDSDNDGMPDIWEIDNSLDLTNATDAADDIEPDGLTNLEEYQNGTDPRVADSDTDGMPDGWEVDNSLDPLVDDTAGDPDGDGLSNFQEYQAGTDPQDNDSDSDGMPDGWEMDNSLDPLVDDATGDPDNDQLNNLAEYQEGTDPQDSDSDNDGMPDGWEVDNNLNPLVDDSAADPDVDGLNNVGEYQAGSDPNDSDSDNDGMPDGWERSYLLNLNFDDSALDPDVDGLTNLEEYGLGTSPVSSDTDADGMPDDWEVDNGLNPVIANSGGDADSDGLLNLAEYQEGTDPQNPDSDGDGLNDGTEVNTLSTNPLLKDSDGDGLEDGQEVNGTTVIFDSFESGNISNPPWTNTGDIVWQVDSASSSDGSKSCRLSFAPLDTDGALRFDGQLPNQGEFRFDASYDLWTGWDSTSYFIVTDLQTSQEVYYGSFSSGWNTHVISLPQGPVSIEFSCDHNGANTSTWIRIDKIELVAFATNTDPADDDSDNDGLDDGEEIQDYGTDPNDDDSDGDGLSDGDEVNVHGSDPLSQDGDGDGMPDNWEVMHQLQPAVDDAAGDADSDGLNNLGEYNESTFAQDPDTDNDGLNDGDEVHTYSSDPLVSDTDGDTLLDGTEVHTYGTSPTLPDTDGDTLRDDAELFTHGTDPTKSDSENDGMPDNWELDNGLLPMIDDAAGDPDSDLLVNLDEFIAGTDPQNSDSDGDTLLDGDEVHTHQTDPNLIDSDGEGLTDAQEVNGWGTDPNDPDTDGDGISDRDETEINHSNPFASDTDGDGLSDYAEDHSRAAFIDSFERTNPGPDWLVSGESPFSIYQLNTYPYAHEGSKCMRSGYLVAGQHSSMSITKDTSAGFLKFWFMKDGEATDILKVFIDGELEGSFTGDTYYWEEVSLPISAGTHTILWEYWEDDNFHNDEVYVDLVQFPLAAVGSDSNDPDSDDDGLNDLEEVNLGTDPLDSDSDNDGIPDGEEVNDTGTDPLLDDTDADGMLDGWEIAHGLDPLVDDSGDDPDSDNLTNGQEFSIGTWPDRLDTDGDGMPDGWENQYGQDPLTDDSDTDADTDEVTALDEFNAGSRPDVVDTDGDGMPDRWEIDHGLDPAVNDSAADPDSDGLTNGEEFTNGSDPHLADTDGDGLSDGDEVDTHGTDPAVADSDGDGLSDGQEVNTYSTLPLDSDSDNDGLSDGDEVNQYGSNPLAVDSDGDGLADGAEVDLYGSNPASTDSDGDGLSDAREVSRTAVEISREEFDQNVLPSGWSTGGDESWWVIPVNITSDRLSSKAYLNDNENSWVEYSVTTPKGIVRFDFHLSSEYQSDYLTFSIDGNVQMSRSGYTREIRSFPVVAGSHTFRWDYTKDASGSSGDDGASLYWFSVLLPGTNTDPARSDSDGDLNNDGYEMAQQLDPWGPYSASAYNYWDISVVETSVSQANTGIALDSSGIPHVSYSKINVGARYGTFAGSTWTSETAMASTDIGHTDIALTSAESPRIVCAGNGGREYYLSKSGGSWTTDTIYPNADGGAPSLAIDSSDTPFVSYYSFSADRLYVEYFNGSVWNARTVVNGSDKPCWDPAISISTSNSPAVAYYQGRPNPDDGYGHIDASCLHFAELLSNGVTWTNIIVDVASGNTGWNPSMAIDTNGHRHIASQDINNGALRYAYYNGSSWSRESIDDDCIVGDYASLVLDTNGNPWVAYYDKSNTALKLARKSTLGWRISTVDSDGDVGRYCSLAVGVDGRPYMIYYDATNQRLKYAVVNPAYTDADLDVLSLREEGDHGTDPNLADSDGDGLDDGVEVWQTRTSPTDSDSDNDTLSDGDEKLLHNTNPLSNDTDGDGMPDGWEVLYGLDPLVDDASLDADGDGVDNGDEKTRGLLPDNIDTDADGVPDGWEIDHGADPLVDDADQDPDGDGLSFLDEYLLTGTISGPDSDDDGLVNGAELHTYGTDPLDPDTDDDGMSDGWEIQYGFDPLVDDSALDADGDGLSNGEEFVWQLNPTNRDTDGDNLWDGWEVNIYGTSPWDVDSDGDGISDYVETRRYMPYGADFEDAAPAGVQMMSLWGPAETGSFGFDWTTGGDVEWGLVSDMYVDAPKSARSGAVDENQISWLEYSADNLSGEISFWVRTDCLAGRDALRFSIDGGLRQIWSGELGWTFVAFAISDGSHTFRWEYQRGAGGTNALNGVWMDSIQLANPGTGTDANSGDTDGDGMGDGWEIDEGFDPLIDDGDDDADGDQLSNSAEFTAETDPHLADTDNDGHDDYQEVMVTGMNPTNANSVFKVDTLSIAPSEAIIRWPSVTGRLYDVWFSSNLLDGFIPVESNLPASTGGYNEYTNSSPTAPAFYRVNVKKP